MSIIKVNSEIGPLKKVLLHRPGDENLNLTPDTLERLLFDDIPYLTLAQKEHDYFANALRAEGVEVIYLVDLVVSVLEQSADIRTAFLRQFIDEGGVRSNTVKSALFEFLDSISDTRQLVHKTIAGVEERELGLDKNNHDFFLTKQHSPLLLDPMPNLYASRDPFASIGSGGASIHRMKNTVRARETIFAETIFKHHRILRTQHFITTVTTTTPSKAVTCRCCAAMSSASASLSAPNRALSPGLPSGSSMMPTTP